MQGVKTRQKSDKSGKDGQKIRLKLGEKNLVSLKKFAKGIMYYVEKTKKKKWHRRNRIYNCKLNVKVHNGNIKMKNHEIKREQFQQKRMFRTNAFQLYKELNGTGKEEYISP